MLAVWQNEHGKVNGMADQQHELVKLAAWQNELVKLAAWQDELVM